MVELICTSLMLGTGLAMDACAVSMTDGLNEPAMKGRKAVFVASLFGFFQALMPMVGWVCVTLIVDKFTAFAAFVPYIAFALLAFIGGKMLFDGFKDIAREKRESKNTTDNVGETTDEQSQTEQKATNVKNAACKKLTVGALLLQAVATSIDALSAGFSLSDIAGDNVWYALIACGIIAVITFGISIGAIYLGKKFGDKLGAKAEVLGGFVLVAIGLEILIKGIFF